MNLARETNRWASEEASDLPPAGWYPDPEQAQTQRLGDDASR
jgi:hypothetical protein